MIWMTDMKWPRVKWYIFSPGQINLSLSICTRSFFPFSLLSLSLFSPSIHIEQALHIKEHESDLNSAEHLDCFALFSLHEQRFIVHRRQPIVSFVFCTKFDNHIRRLKGRRRKRTIRMGKSSCFSYIGSHQSVLIQYLCDILHKCKPLISFLHRTDWSLLMHWSLLCEVRVSSKDRGSVFVP